MAVFDTATEGDRTTITVPSGVQAGDLIVLADVISESDDTPVLPMDFTSLKQVDDSGDTGLSFILSAKVADGTEGGTSVTGMSTGTKVMIVFRPSRPLTGFNGFSGGVEATSGDPASQSVTIGANKAPILILAAYGFFGLGPGTQDFSPSEDGTVSVSGADDLYVKHKYYPQSALDTTVDLNDATTSQVLASVGLTLSF